MEGIIKNDIVGHSSVISGTELSLSLVTFLIEQGHEEEKLDFKEGFDVSNKTMYQKNKVDLVCDIIAMANADGGYILLGVSEREGKFLVTGVSDELIEKWRPEDINTILNQYVDAPPRVRVAVYEYNSKKVLAMSIIQAMVAIPFCIDGQYERESDKKCQTKFYNGDIFVRHSAKSEKASFADMKRFEEQIREDERNKLSLTITGINKIVGRLDVMTGLLGGRSQIPLDSDIRSMSPLEIENYFFELVTDRKKDRYYSRLLRKYFGIYYQLMDGLDGKSLDEMKETLARETKPFLARLGPAWVGLLDASDRPHARVMADYIYKLYSDVSERNIFNDGKGENLLYILTEIVKLVYILGAIAIKKNDIDFCSDLTDQKGDLISSELQDSNWFRFVLTWLSRYKLLDIPSLVLMAYRAYKEDQYLLDIFENEKDFEAFLCQFDFLQCLRTLYRGLPIIRCYPSFKWHEKRFVEPFIVDYIYKPWSDDFKPKLAKAINDLDMMNIGGASTSPWLPGWQDQRIVKFLQRYLPQVSVSRYKVASE